MLLLQCILELLSLVHNMMQCDLRGGRGRRLPLTRGSHQIYCARNSAIDRFYNPILSKLVSVLCQYCEPDFLYVQRCHVLLLISIVFLFRTHLILLFLQRSEVIHCGQRRYVIIRTLPYYSNYSIRCNIVVIIMPLPRTHS